MKLNELAPLVTDYRVGPKQKRISGMYQTGQYEFKQFEIKGPKAMELHKLIVALHDKNTPQR